MPKHTPFPTGAWNYVQQAERDETGERPDDYEHPSEAPIRLKVAIVGAGVGGLATAVALRRDGHEVHVYEDAPALSELGAGIQVPPNSLTIMHKWGVEEAIKAKSVEPKNLWWKRWQDGKVIAKTRYKPDFEENFGVPYRVIHRAHLHEALHDKAVDLGVRIHLGHTVASYDPERPSIRFTNGKEVVPDLLVAGDGLKSTARQVITGERIPLRSHGFAAYRACVPVEEMRKNRLIAKNMDFERDQSHVMSYPIKGGEDWNLVITVPEQKEPCHWDDYSRQSLSIMRSFYAGWDPTLIEILKLVKTTFKWPVQDIPQLDSWTSPSKKMLILGDAAHAMLPSMAAGASIAIEDAYALAQALRLIQSRHQLPDAIATWESVRIPRYGDAGSQLSTYVYATSRGRTTAESEGSIDGSGAVGVFVRSGGGGQVGLGEGWRWRWAEDGRPGYIEEGGHLFDDLGTTLRLG
ncbi:hypothetical protein M409DRAFT_25485 [Zasmidium cellare ATCC 36951]|uniref:FAD-binding domain-containing protein n=1 Tax=Zasmidium cellare ATCC 36951 TaxID=1080233 RepID=A0A6A6CD81_ZASCE|nr:uncharacterized protein M409DRAFT_25485 [Zasmidium cellare ATCC 36951]KAF2164138.1 hypothetical protein M409DRAFT_25485 [Zasmidium cellare ATCC 36951]